MITSSGAVCDVCGKHILPIDPEERVNFFTLKQMPGKKLCCHNRCKQTILDCKGDWEKLPAGPLRSAYEEVATPFHNPT